MALLNAAKQAQADLVLVHHGFFWKNEEVRIVGIKKTRIKFLLENDLNLMAYHFH
jgi:putative NIF3 family GTP cyclohydrolase 1 type 2